MSESVFRPRFTRAVVKNVDTGIQRYFATQPTATEIAKYIGIPVETFIQFVAADKNPFEITITSPTGSEVKFRVHYTRRNSNEVRRQSPSSSTESTESHEDFPGG